MRRNRQNNMKRERIIMITSSALVLAALTMTGLYMKGQEIKEQDDGYTLDLAALENNTEKKPDEIGEMEKDEDIIIGGGSHTMESELDYMPLEEELSAEVGSGTIQIPGLTGETLEEAPEDELTAEEEVLADQKLAQETAGEPVNEVEPLHYSEEQGLTRPVSGEILLPYSMDGSIYFATLDQYKYNPATIFAATEGTEVVACAAGKVTSVSESAQLGKCITIELGDGYAATYGQMAEVLVEENSVVKAGDKLGTVAEPTRYYTLEGPNLYFSLEKDGTPVNAEKLF